MGISTLAVPECTSNTYRAGFANYVSFCNMFSLNPIPVCEHTLMYYVTASASRLCYSTLRVYLAAIQFFRVMRGDLFRIVDMHQPFYIAMVMVAIFNVNAIVEKN